MNISNTTTRMGGTCHLCRTMRTTALLAQECTLPAHQPQVNAQMWGFRGLIAAGVGAGSGSGRATAPLRRAAAPGAIERAWPTAAVRIAHLARIRVVSEILARQISRLARILKASRPSPQAFGQVMRNGLSEDSCQMRDLPNRTRENRRFSCQMRDLHRRHWPSRKKAQR